MFVIWLDHGNLIYIYLELKLFYFPHICTYIYICCVYLNFIAASAQCYDMKLLSLIYKRKLQFRNSFLSVITAFEQKLLIFFIDIYSTEVENCRSRLHFIFNSLLSTKVI